MEKEFVTYEQALALKELGYQSTYKDFFGYYSNKGELRSPFHPSLSIEVIDAPLYQQAFRFFREKFGFNSYIEAFKDGTYDYWLQHQTYFNGQNVDYGDGTFETYEQAEQACLDKLIEIARNAKKCAIIAVDEILSLFIVECEDTRFWKEVKQEIEKL